MFNFLKKNTLYFPGCLNKFVLKDIANNYVNVLRNLDVDFMVLKDDEVCCGAPAYQAGYQKDFENLKDKNLELFRKYKIKKIITPSPQCAFTFSKMYDIKTEHVTQTILRHQDKIPLKHEEEITYFDPCYMGRYTGVTDAPRKILDLLGFEVIELQRNKDKTQCCGGNLNLKQNLPLVANKVAKNILSQVKTKKLVTTCPSCYLHFKENSENIQVLELSEVLL